MARALRRIVYIRSTGLPAPDGALLWRYRTMTSNTTLENRARFLRVAGALLAVVVVALLTMLALSRERDSVLDGQWELVLIELPTESIQPADLSWIEIQDDQFHGIGECLTFRGSLAFPSDRRLSIDDMTSIEECAPLSPVDDAYTDQFSRISSYKATENGFLTLQSSDASIQFSYEWRASTD